MKFPILLSTVALISALCSACSDNKSCLTATFGEIALSYAVLGQSNQALPVAQRMDKSQIKVEVLSQIAFQTAKAGQAKQATAMFTQAIQEANKLELPPDRVMGLESIATKYRQLGQNDKASELLSQAVQGTDEIWGVSFVKDSVLERIAVSYAKLRNPERGIQLTHKIVEDIPKGRALAQIVSQYIAQENYEQARDIANTIEFQASKANALIKLASKTGEYQQALAAAQQIDEEESPQLKSIILSKIALLYSKAGQEKQAVELLSQAVQVVKRIEESASQINQFTKIALLFVEVGKKEQAVDVASQALQIARNIPDAAKKAVFFAGVAVVYGKAGRNELSTSIFTQAFQLAQGLEKKDNKAHTLAELAIAYAKIQPYNQVLQLTQTLGDSNTQAYALIQIARDYAQTKRQKEALQALEQAFDIVQSSNHNPDKAQRLAEIAAGLGNIAQYDRQALLQANGTMDSSVSRFVIEIAQTIDKLNNSSSQVSAFARIAGVYAKTGHKEKAIALLSQALETAKTTKCSE